MTELVDTRDTRALGEAIRLVDESLARMAERQMATANDVSDLLLDLRLLLMRAEAEAAASVG